MNHHRIPKEIRGTDDKSPGVENVTRTYDCFVASDLLPDVSFVDALGRGALSALQPVSGSAAGGDSPRGTQAETHYVP
jgi:hypothetical protein